MEAIWEQWAHGHGQENSLRIWALWHGVIPLEAAIRWLVLFGQKGMGMLSDNAQ